VTSCPSKISSISSSNSDSSSSSSSNSSASSGSRGNGNKRNFAIESNNIFIACKDSTVSLSVQESNVLYNNLN
jgi:hypothetical protein